MVGGSVAGGEMPPPGGRDEIGFWLGDKINPRGTVSGPKPLG